MARLDVMLRELKESGGSDLHLSAGVVPRMRKRGGLVDFQGQPVLDDAAVGSLLKELTPPALWETFTTSNDVDFAYALPGVARFRVNLFRQEFGRAAVMRVIPEKIIPLEDLKLPAAVESLAHARDGLILVTGPTGSGKSTTLASIINKINRTYQKHIVTIEDPVEFVHQNDQCVFSHREVGQHTQGFGPALRAAIRQDADVLLVGEMRDYETISLALTAAEMGMLVFGTLHTNGAAKTIDRLVDAFPAEQQPQARLSLSESLCGIVSQLLIPTADGQGRVAATEIMVRTPGLPNVIREGNTAMLFSIIQAGRQQGMQTMDMALMEFFQKKVITFEEAFNRATDKAAFEGARKAAHDPMGLGLDAAGQLPARAAKSKEVSYAMPIAPAVPARPAGVAVAPAPKPPVPPVKPVA
jgi:twitching motility protein PilT